MAKLKIIAGLLLFLLVISTAWQIASCELANYELKDDLKDVAALAGSRIGLLAESSDDDLRDAVIRRAVRHDIHLWRNQIRVQRSGTEENPAMFLEVRYRARIVFPGASLVFHFKTTSE
ncbi:MAG TPA: hypothetical protein VMP68_21605 [Candidatus Eisenbacteria bacterium]|nr:hypothetical protein [Candidatus Eisenbacteria bacterium]